MEIRRKNSYTFLVTISARELISRIEKATQFYAIRKNGNWELLPVSQGSYVDIDGVRCGDCLDFILAHKQKFCWSGQTELNSIQREIILSRTEWEIEIDAEKAARQFVKRTLYGEVRPYEENESR